MNKPNLFIIGAPKCGTTSIAVWLKNQPQVFISADKEPNYFSADVRVRKRINKDDYLGLFEGINNSHVWLGEASTRYLYSKVACDNILSFCDSPKFIAIIRNPVEMIYSLHNHLSFLGVEQFKSFRKAWGLKDARAIGDNILSTCNDPDSLAYGKIGMVGEQVESFFETVPESQRLVLLFDDLKNHPKLVYGQICNFLEIENGRWNEPVVTNKSMGYRVGFLGDVSKWLGVVKQKCGINKSFGLLGIFNKWNRIEKKREPLADDLQIEMQEYFRNDILKLEQLLGRDLSHWLR